MAQEIIEFTLPIRTATPRVLAALGCVQFLTGMTAVLLVYWFRERHWLLGSVGAILLAGVIATAEFTLGSFVFQWTLLELARGLFVSTAAGLAGIGFASVVFEPKQEERRTRRDRRRRNRERRRTGRRARTDRTPDDEDTEPDAATAGAQPGDD